MKIVLDDISGKNNLYPFSAIRSIADIRVGVLTVREKWEKLLGQKINTTSEINLNDSDLGDAEQIPSNIVPSQQWLNSVLNKQNITNTILEYPWHIFQNNDKAIKEDFELLCKGRRSLPISSTNKIISPENIFIEADAAIEHSVLNATEGPIYIGKNALVMEGCLIRGPVAICEGSILKMGTKIYGATTIGPYCMAG